MKVRPSLVLFDKDRVLLMEYNYGGKEVLAIPGGNPLAGEQMEETLVRELHEELGIEVEVSKLLLITQGSRKNGKENILHCVFAAALKKGKPKLNPAHTTAIGLHWIPIEKLNSEKINLYPNVGPVLFEAWQNGLAEEVRYIPKIVQPWF